MKNGKAAGPSVMVKSVCPAKIDMMTYLLIVEVSFQRKWELGIIGNRKGDALETRNYKGLKLTDMILELLKLSISTTTTFLQSF